MASITSLTVKEESIVQENVVIDGEVRIVKKVVIVEKVVMVEKKEIVSENIPCVFIYISVLDLEEAQMYVIAQQHSGPFTTTGTHIREGNDEGFSGRSYTVTV